MAQSKIIVGLEIGTSKTCMVVGEVRPDATATILGIGEVPSAGVRKGEITDQSMARQCVCDAWQIAQDHADVDIVDVYLSITGKHIYGEDSIGAYRLPDNESIITDEHAALAREKAEKIEIPADRFVINREPGEYTIDGGDNTRHPAGLSGRTIDVSSHVIHGIKTRLQNSLLCVRKVPLEVTELVFAPLATAQLALGRTEKQAGALLIDIGGGTSDYILYKNGNILVSGCIPIGGYTINDDIMALSDQRIKFKAAEVLKCTEGNAIGDRNDRSLVHYRSELGMHEVSLERGKLNAIIIDRLEDIFVRIFNKVPPELRHSRTYNVYLTGGTSLLPNIARLAAGIFGVKVFAPNALEGERHAYLQDPRYCTAIGLIRYAQRQDDSDIFPTGANPIKRFFNFLLGR